VMTRAPTCIIQRSAAPERFQRSRRSFGARGRKEARQKLNVIRPQWLDRSQPLEIDERRCNRLSDEQGGRCILRKLSQRRSIAQRCARRTVKRQQNNKIDLRVSDRLSNIINMVGVHCVGERRSIAPGRSDPSDLKIEPIAESARDLLLPGSEPEHRTARRGRAGFVLRTRHDDDIIGSLAVSSRRMVWTGGRWLAPSGACWRKVRAR